MKLQQNFLIYSVVFM